MPNIKLVISHSVRTVITLDVREVGGTKMSRYNVGDLVRLYAIFTVDGAYTDPTTVILTVQDPSAALTTPALTNPDIGRYYADVTITQAGEWRFKFEGDAPAQGAEEGVFYVREERVP